MKVANYPQLAGRLDSFQQRRLTTSVDASIVETGVKSKLDQFPAPLLHPLPGRYDLHRFWAQVGSIQQQSTAVQMTLRALAQTRQGLRDMLRLFASVREANSFKGWTTRLQEQKRLVGRLPQQTHYRNLRLLTQAFRPTLLGYQDIREFSVAGLNLLASAERDEQFELILLGGRPIRVGLSIKGDSLLEVRIRQVSRAFARIGIRSRVDEENRLVFSVPMGQWMAVNGQLYIRGGGVRIPTGDPIKLQLDPDISWREIGLWKLGNEDELNLAESRILTLDREIDSHFFLLQQMQSQWMEQLRIPPHTLNTTNLETLMEGVMSCFAEESSQPLRLFMTQANIQRGTVQNILAGMDGRLKEP